jgi:hypothetical protein
MMMQHNQQQPELIELGAASVETKGQALFRDDVGGGQRLFISGELAG